MTPGRLVTVLGLCNVVAGALLVGAPTLVAPIEGVHSPAATLAARSAAALLVAIAIGAWRMPAEARAPYLWIFGVGVKLAAGVIWAGMAISTGVRQVWLGAGLDVGVAALIAIGLLSTPGRARPRP